ncbi:FG-GAP repeat domain-containing protein [Streptomyces violascens]|uniref:FG-GAP repeat domain-containing protein n=1 Tax=Streptomyces violascens TaxID=67381 RepID=UPI0036C1AD89
MRNTRMSSRARRIAACTAIAVAAGTLLSTPALADTKGPGAPKAAATAKVKPRFDYNGDGKGDIVLSRAGSMQISVDGSADRTIPFFMDERRQDIKDVITPGDLDGNGQPELMWTDAEGTLYMKANFDNAQYGYDWESTGWNKYDRIVAAGDLTGDGKNDLIARTYNGDVYLFAGTGDLKAPFAAGVKVAEGWSDFDQIVGVADADGDGVGDLYVRNRTDDLLFIGGTGNAAKPFKAPVQLGAGWHAYNQLLSADDLDGDGLSDLLARTENGDLYMYRAKGDGSFADPVKWQSGWQAAALLGNSGASRGYGKDQFFARDAKDVNWRRMALNNGQFTGAFVWGPGNTTDPDPYARYTVAIANALSRNGTFTRLQVVDGKLHVDGDHQGGSRVADGDWSAYDSIVGPGDLSGDGLGDLLARDKAGTLWLFQGDGSGTKFAAPVRLGGGWNTYNKILGSGDVNGDGRADLLARGTDGHLYLYPGTGNSAAPFRARQDLGGGWNGYTELAAVADATGNGTTDVIATDASGEAYRYDGQGAYGGKFKPRAELGGGWNIYNELF